MNFGALSSSSLPRHVIRSTIARAAALQRPLFGPAPEPDVRQESNEDAVRRRRRVLLPPRPRARVLRRRRALLAAISLQERVPERRADGVFRGQDRDRDEAVAGTRAHRNDPNARSRRAARKPWARAVARARTRRQPRVARMSNSTLSSRLCGARPMFFRGVSSLKKKKN